MRVIDSRRANSGVKRRRECIDCHHRLTTLELAIDIDRDPNVIKLYDKAISDLISAAIRVVEISKHKENSS
jgi:transcriptional regulator NrdR family protein